MLTDRMTWCSVNDSLDPGQRRSVKRTGQSRCSGVLFEYFASSAGSEHHGIDGSGARIEKALRDLCKQNAEITISSVSRRAGVTRKSIYHRADLVSLIRAHRPLGAVTDDPPAPPVDAQTSIVAALRSRLAAKDAQIADLKASLRERDRTIAALHGELDKRIAASPG